MFIDSKNETQVRDAYNEFPPPSSMHTQVTYDLEPYDKFQCTKSNRTQPHSENSGLTTQSSYVFCTGIFSFIQHTFSVYSVPGLVRIPGNTRTNKTRLQKGKACILVGGNYSIFYIFSIYLYKHIYRCSLTYDGVTIQ